MSQININITREFAKDLEELMKFAGIKSKSDAIRLAVHDMLNKVKSKRKSKNFRSLLGMGLKAPVRTKGLLDEDSLWEK